MVYKTYLVLTLALMCSLPGHAIPVDELEREARQVEEEAEHVLASRRGDGANDVALGIEAEVGKWNPCDCSPTALGSYDVGMMTFDRCKKWDDGDKFEWCYIKGGRACKEFEVFPSNGHSGHFWRKCDSYATRVKSTIQRGADTIKRTADTVKRGYHLGAAKVKSTYDSTRRIVATQNENSDKDMQCGPERNPKEFSCGPEVGHNVRKTMYNMFGEWEKMRMVERVGRCSGLVSMLQDKSKASSGWSAIAMNAWDFGDFAYIDWNNRNRYSGRYIEKFFGCGKGSIDKNYACQGTLSVDGKCHHNSAINYCLWGMLMSLCGSLNLNDHLPGPIRASWRRVRNGFAHFMSTGYKLVSSASAGSLQPFIGDVANMVTQCRKYGDELMDDASTAKLEFPETNYRYWQCRNTCPTMDFVAPGATSKVKWYLGGSKAFMRPNPPIMDMAIHRKRMQEMLNEARTIEGKVGDKWPEELLALARRISKDAGDDHYFVRGAKILISWTKRHNKGRLPDSFQPYLQVQGTCMCYTLVRLVKVTYSGDNLGTTTTLGARVTGSGPMEDIASPSGLGHKLHSTVQFPHGATRNAKDLTCRPILFEGYRPCEGFKLRLHARFEIDNLGTNPTSPWAYTDVNIGACPAKDTRARHTVSAHARERGESAIAHYHFEVTTGRRGRDNFDQNEDNVDNSQLWYEAYHQGDTKVKN